MNTQYIKIFFKEKIDILLAFCVPVLSILFSVTITKPVYMMNDDFLLRSFVEGRYLGIHSEFTFFINCLYMKFLKFLYHINDSLPWYDFSFAFLMFVSIFIITFITNKILQNKFLKILNSFILLVYSFVFFTTFQFTLVAEILAVSAIALFGFILFSENISKTRTFFYFSYVILALIIAGLIRYQVLHLIFLISVIFSIFFIRNLHFSKQKLFLIISVILIFFLNIKLNDYNVSEHNRVLPNFFEYNKELNFLINQTTYRMGDIDFKNFIQNIELELKKSNFSINDYQLLIGWYSTGDNIYSGENIKSLRQNISSKVTPNKNHEYFLKKFPNTFSTYFFQQEFIILQLLLILILALAICKKNFIYTILSIHFVFIFILTYLGIWLKPLPVRVYFPLLVLEYIFMIFSASYYKHDFLKFPKIKVIQIINLLLILIAYFIFFNEGFIKKVQSNNIEYKNYLAIKNFNFNNYQYIFTDPLISYCLASPYDMNYINLNNIIVYNWNVYSKHYDYKMQRLNMERNLFVNLLRNDVYLLGINNVTPVKELQKSLKEHQNIDSEVIKADTVLADKLYLYKFIQKKNK